MIVRNSYYSPGVEELNLISSVKDRMSGVEVSRLLSCYNYYSLNSHLFFYFRHDRDFVRSWVSYVHYLPLDERPYEDQFRWQDKLYEIIFRPVYSVSITKRFQYIEGWYRGPYPCFIELKPNEQFVPQDVLDSVALNHLFMVRDREIIHFDSCLRSTDIAPFVPEAKFNEFPPYIISAQDADKMYQATNKSIVQLTLIYKKDFEFYHYDFVRKTAIQYYKDIKKLKILSSDYPIVSNAAMKRIKQLQEDKKTKLYKLLENSNDPNERLRLIEKLKQLDSETM